MAVFAIDNRNSVGGWRRIVAFSLCLLSSLHKVLANISLCFGITGPTSACVRYLALCFWAFVLVTPAVLQLPGNQPLIEQLKSYLNDEFTTIILHPFTAAVSTSLAFLLILSVNRAWALNEIYREKLAHRVLPGDPDATQDLRREGAITALLLLPLLPLWLSSVNSAFCEADGVIECAFSEGHTYGAWFSYAFASVFRAILLLDISEVYNWEPNSSVFVQNQENAQHLRMVIRASLDLIIVFTVFERLRINKFRNFAVASLDTTPDNAIAVGKRILPKLKAIIEADTSDQENLFYKNAAIAVGAIGQPSSFPLLKDLAEKESNQVRNRAIQGIDAMLKKIRQRIGSAKSKSVKARLNKTEEEIIEFLEERQEKEAEGTLPYNAILDALDKGA